MERSGEWNQHECQPVAKRNSIYLTKFAFNKIIYAESHDRIFVNIRREAFNLLADFACPKRMANM